MSSGWPLIPAFWLGLAPVGHAILAGGEFDEPVDSPSWRVDAAGADSPFHFVGALEMTTSGGRTFLGSAVAISPHWALTAGHNVDFNDDGAADAGLAVNFHLPGFGAYAAGGMITHPLFSGFGNPTIFHDIALLRFDDPLPAGLALPMLGGSALAAGDLITLAGFGRSGYGSYGYTTQSTLTTRRLGGNRVEALESTAAGDGVLFRYTFHAPDSPLSLGNGIETIIGPGDSGGPALRAADQGWELAGINTFTEGYGGRFGDTGGGVALEPYWDWIFTTTGIPEPRTPMLLAVAAGWFAARRRRTMNGNQRN